MRYALREFLEEGLHQVQLIIGQLYALQGSVDLSNILADIGEDAVLGLHLDLGQFITYLYRIMRSKERPEHSNERHVVIQQELLEPDILLNDSEVLALQLARVLDRERIHR
jgi:hypothetical protein